MNKQKEENDGHKETKRMRLKLASIKEIILDELYCSNCGECNCGEKIERIFKKINET